MNKDWWKWGNLEESKHINDYPKAKQYLEEFWQTSFREEFKPPTKFNLAQLSDKKTEEIKNIFASIPQKKMSFKDSDRLKVALGKSYYDVIRICKNDNIIAPDFVFYPTTKQEIEYIVQQCNDNNIKIIPFGGGSNVVGALTQTNKTTLTCCINLQHFNKMIAFDEDHFTATFQAGILGPDLEDELNEKGFTLGHFPQSFEYSTLGGWVVTRGAGQESSYYGKIEDLVEQLCVVTPTGTLYTNDYSHDASGINLMPLFVGSEGTLGIVTEVTVKIKKLPKSYRWVVALFPNFEQGTNYLKAIAQADIKPSVVRLSDAKETMLFSKLGNNHTEKGGLVEQFKKEAQKFILDWKNLNEPCVLIMRFVQNSYNSASQMVYAKNLVDKYDGMIAPSSIGENWAANRFKTPYLRDTFVEHAVYIDTMETLIHWNDVLKLHQELTSKLEKSKAFNKNKGLFLAHISHIYANAACMYFTLITPMHKGSEIEQWQEIKNLVTDTIKRNNGSVSHHHSVGYDHQKWYLQYSDPIGLDILRSIKNKIDPKNILNPGKLFNK
ncbi:MAG: FAD-binding oxidoreductase [Chitinophagales bacterium]|nr:FAD-binding oxidoreductase [Chitinophagales bacterium]